MVVDAKASRLALGIELTFIKSAAAADANPVTVHRLVSTIVKASVKAAALVVADEVHLLDVAAFVLHCSGYSPASDLRFFIKKLQNTSKIMI
ncbi:MAG TPA: hypothetical protein VGB00_02485 [Pyrinomonadaceae bacterium]